MSQLVIRSENSDALRKLAIFIQSLDFETVMSDDTPQPSASETEIPIEWATEKPDALGLAGIWKNNPRSLEAIREQAWGERL